MSKKGISPLIASVVLIAVTLAIAGFLSTWSIQTVQNKAGQITTESECIGSISADGVNYNSASKSLNFILWNSNKNLNLNDAKVFLTYSGGVQAVYDLNECCKVPEPLTTKPIAVSITNVTSKPTKMQLSSDDCGIYYKPEFVVP